jgi:hypothetical protein
MKQDQDDWKQKRNEKSLKQYTERLNRERRREALELADKYEKRRNYPARDDDDSHGF